MSVQVCLGKIDAWVMESDSATSFLETTFGTKLDIPDDDLALISECGCDEGTHWDNEECQSCGCDFSSHEDSYCPDREMEYFECEKFQFLKEFIVTGNYETTFRISKKIEQTKFTKFLDFIS